jgi:hypothetical protein
VKRLRAHTFDGYVLENGNRRQATQAELREAHRLWWKHADIRTGRVLRENEKGTA